jgi:adenylyltransferase/sulfurtransferase
MSGAAITACVIGAGGLGCSALLALSAAGVDELLVVDHDTVAAHNLQRQVLYTTADVGRPKVEAAAHRLRARLPGLAVHPMRRRVGPDDVDALLLALPAGAVVLEGSDDAALKFAVNDAALRRGIPAVVGAALRWQGQAIAVAAGHACYRCVHEAPPPAEALPTCAEAGVIGAGVGLVGSLMAALALGLRARPAETAGRLLAIDLLQGSVRTLAPAPRAGCPACAASAALAP